MLTDLPITFDDALKLLRAREIFANDLSAKEIKALHDQVHQFAFTSAHTTDAGYLQKLWDMIEKSFTGGGGAPGTSISLPDFIANARGYLAGIGYAPAEGEAGTIKDLASDPRLKLIAKTNHQILGGFGQRTLLNKSVKALPCQELYRALFTDKQRDWFERWDAAGGELFDGRMLATVDDDVWQALGDGEGGFESDALGNSWAPFAFNSGMRTRPISRAEAVRLGIIDEGDEVEPMDLELERDPGDLLANYAAPIASALKTILKGTTP